VVLGVSHNVIVAMYFVLLFLLRVEDGCRSETRIYFESYLNLTSFEYLHFLYMISMWASDALKCPGVAVNVIIRPGTELHSCQKQAA